MAGHDPQGPPTDESHELRIIATLCGGGSCPTVYATSRGTLVIQGPAVAPDLVGVAVQDGELLVEVPEDFLRRTLLESTASPK